MSTEGEQETKTCKTCRRQIPVLSYTTHDLHCQRNTVICEICKEPFDKKEIATHKDTVHKRVSCDLCRGQMEQHLLADHIANSCSHRPVQCSYCEVNVEHCKLADHEEMCGNRTEKCEKCNRFVKVKDALLHESKACQYPPLPPPATSTRFEARHPQIQANPTMGSGLLRLPAYRGEPSGDLWEFQRGPPSHSTSARSTGVRVVEDDNLMDIRPPPIVTRSTKKPDDQELCDFELAKRLEEEEAKQIAQDRFLALQLENEGGATAFPPPWDPPPVESVPRVPSSFTVKRDHSPVRHGSPVRSVPCSRCHMMMPETNLLEHESICKFSDHAYEAPSDLHDGEVREACHYCQGMYRVTELPLHVANCSFNDTELLYAEPVPPRSTTLASDFGGNYPAQRGPVEDVVFLPCEFCGELFPPETFTKHEEDCQRHFNNPATAHTGIWSS